MPDQQSQSLPAFARFRKNITHLRFWLSLLKN